MKEARILSAEPIQPRKQWVIVAIVAAVVAAGAATVVLLLPAKTVKPDPKDAANAAKFVGTKDFKKLPMEERMKYMRDMGRPNRAQFANLSETERRAMFENMRAVRRAEMDKRLKAFFAMSKEEQDAQLDKDIARMQEMMKNRPPRPPQANAQNGQGNQQQGANRQRQAPSAQQRRERDASMNPARGAQMQVYMERLKQRAAATGQTLPTPPRGGGPR